MLRLVDASRIYLHVVMFGAPLPVSNREAGVGVPFVGQVRLA